MCLNFVEPTIWLLGRPGLVVKEGNDCGIEIQRLEVI
jgi:hypothetical protein